MKHFRVLFGVICTMFLAVGLSPAAPSPVQATNQVPDGLTPADWATIQSSLPSDYLKASNTGGADMFGAAVAIDGDTVVVGAYGEDSNTTGVNGNQTNNSAIWAGAVYVFTRADGMWSQQAYLKASNTEAEDHFGSAVDIDGDTIVVGAFGESSNATGVNGDQANNSAPGSGAVYIFTRTAGVWSQQAYLKASNTGVGDYFGGTVAIDGDTIIVGANRESSNAIGVNGNQTDNSAFQSGAAYVFTRTAGIWSQQAYLKASNSDPGDRFGTAVAVDGDTVVVGALWEDSNATGVNGDQEDDSISATGAAYIFTRTAGIWSQQAYLKASNTEAEDYFGSAVAIGGDTVVVNANGEDSNTTGVNGNQTDNSASYAGAAYVFTRIGGVWSQEAYLKASNAEAGDYFGVDVVVEGNTILVGANGEDSNATGVNGNQTNNLAINSGAAYVFTRTAGVWSQQAYLKASNTEVSDWFGGAIAVDSDTIIVGARGEDSNTTGVNGDQMNNLADSSGAVYLFNTSIITPQTPIIFLPGVMGSYLNNTPSSGITCTLRPSGEIWLGFPPIYLPHISIQTLFLDAQGTNPANSCDNISASGIITTVSIPLMMEEDFYGDFLNSLTQAGYQVYPFAYDWRLDIEQTALTLDAKINTVLAQTRATKVILIGHSLGGLVSRQYTSNSSRATKVEQVITVGTPYWGAPAAAYYMRAGMIPVPLNAILPDGIVRTLHRNSPAVMQILPSRAYVQQSNQYFMHNSHVLDYQATTNYFTQNGQNVGLLTLAQTRHTALDDFRPNIYVPSYHVLTANHLPTVGMVREYDCWFGDNNTCWEEMKYPLGDETVPWVSARLKGSVGDWSGNAQVCTFPTLTRVHSTMMGDEYVIADVLNILEGEATTHCLSNAQLDALQLTNTPQERIQIALWGKANVSVEDAFGNSAFLTTEGFAVNTIPNSSYRPDQDTTFVLLPAGQVYTVTVSQQSTQPIQLRVTNFYANTLEEMLEPQTRALFMDIPSAVGGQATLPLDLTNGLESLQLDVDLDDDGSSEYTLAPTSVLDETDMEDLTAPETIIQMDGETDAEGYYTGLVTATLIVTDTGTGVGSTQYSIDGGQTWEIYTEPVSFVAEEVVGIEARSVDMAGNQEAPWPVFWLRPFNLYLPLVQK